MKICGSKEGTIKLADGAVLKLRIAVVHAREVGFSPFAGVNIDVKAIGGIATLKVPEELKEKVKDKPLMPPAPELPKDGWEIVDIEEQEPAVEEVVIDTSKGKFLVRVIAETTMAARNLNYKTTLGEPIYWVSWVWKISWKPIREGKT